jgi:hypothetical protein
MIYIHPRKGSMGCCTFVVGVMYNYHYSNFLHPDVSFRRQTFFFFFFFVVLFFVGKDRSLRPSHPGTAHPWHDDTAHHGPRRYRPDDGCPCYSPEIVSPPPKIASSWAPPATTHGERVFDFSWSHSRVLERSPKGVITSDPRKIRSPIYPPALTHGCGSLDSSRLFMGSPGFLLLRHRLSLSLSISPGVSLCLDSPSISDSLPLSSLHNTVCECEFTNRKKIYNNNSQFLIICSNIQLL